MVVRSLICAGLVAGTLAAGAAPAQAASSVSVSGAQGRAAVAAEGSTTLTLRGRGFQSVEGGHGGVYVMFGTVDGAWQPSRGGGSYAYVADSQTRANAGYQRFVAFPGSDTASEANGGTMSADGSWSTSVVVPGATFTAVDRTGREVQVDCRTDRCGVITIGAHGVVNANNETFTPVEVVSGSAGAAAAPASEAATDGKDGKDGKGEKARTRRPKAAVDPATAVEGHVLTFTATGFRPHEQVVASLDGGVAAVGPLSAGTAGEVAGVLQLPASVRPGTHVLTVTGPLSGAAPELSFPVAAGATDVEPAADRTESASWLPVGFALLGAAALAGSLGFRGVRTLRRRREQEAADA